MNEITMQKTENRIELLNGYIEEINEIIQSIKDFNDGRYLPKDTVLAIKESSTNYKFFELQFQGFKGEMDNKPEAYFWFDTNGMGYWFREIHIDFKSDPISITSLDTLKIFTLKELLERCRITKNNSNYLNIEELRKKNNLGNWELFIPDVECKKIEIKELGIYKTREKMQKELEELKSEKSIDKKI